MAMLMLVSCRLDNGTGTHRTPAAVENYTSGLMYSVVVNSTEFLDEAIVLDTYLKLSILTVGLWSKHISASLIGHDMS